MIVVPELMMSYYVSEKPSSGPEVPHTTKTATAIAKPTDTQESGLPRLLLTRGLGRCECGLVDCFIFDRREFSQSSLPPTAVVRLFDPGDDGQPQLLPAGPRATVQDVLLQEREERFHRRIVRACSHPAHRARQPITSQGLYIAS